MSVNAMFEGCGRDNKTERDFEKCDIEAKLVGSTSHTHHVHGHDMLPADWSAKCRPCHQAFTDGPVTGNSQILRTRPRLCLALYGWLGARWPFTRFLSSGHEIAFRLDLNVA